MEWAFIALFFILLLCALSVLVWRLLVVIRERSCPPLDSLLLTLSLHIFIYLAAVYAAMNFFDATTMFDDRMLLPVYTILILFMLVTTWHHLAARTTDCELAHHSWVLSRTGSWAGGCNSDQYTA